MRRLKTLVVIFLVTAGGTFVSYKLVKLIANDPYLEYCKFSDVFTGYRPKYRKGFTLSDKAAENWKAEYVNASINEIVPYVMIALVIWLSIGGYAGLKVYSGTWLSAGKQRRRGYRY
jgi:hypothetical protein